MANPQKVELVKILKEKFEECQSIFLVTVSGLKVAELTELRTKLRESNTELTVAKNTYLRLAVQGTDFESVLPYLKGSTAVVFIKEDAVASAKSVDEFINSVENRMEIKSALLDGKLLSIEEFKALAKLPSKEELLAKLVYVINSPISGFVNVLAGNIRNLVNVLNAIKDKKE